MRGAEANTTPSLAELIRQRNKLTGEIERMTAETENTPGAMTIVRDFANWHGWYEREGFDDESREELERIVGDAQKLLSSTNGDSK